MPTPDVDAIAEFQRQLARYRDYWAEYGGRETNPAGVVPVSFQCLTANGSDELIELVGLVTL